MLKFNCERLLVACLAFLPPDTKRKAGLRKNRSRFHHAVDEMIQIEEFPKWFRDYFVFDAQYGTSEELAVLLVQAEADLLLKDTHEDFKVPMEAGEALAIAVEVGVDARLLNHWVGEFDRILRLHLL